jgi:type IV pilus assembly protein PilV
VNLQRGFTLIEVLISMVILAIGLLGLAAMQAISLRDNQDAYYYQQATLLAYEMQDRIRGNNVANWTTVTIGTGDCTKDAPCDGQTMANNDYGYWKKSVEAIFPKPIGNAVEIKLSSTENKGACKGTYTTSLCLITRWGRVNSKKTGVLSGDATFRLEVTP